MQACEIYSTSTIPLCAPPNQQGMCFGKVQFIFGDSLLVHPVVLLVLKVKLPLFSFLLVLFGIITPGNSADLQTGCPCLGINRSQVSHCFINVSSILKGLLDVIEHKLSGLLKVMGLLGVGKEVNAILDCFLGVRLGLVGDLLPFVASRCSIFLPPFAAPPWQKTFLLIGFKLMQLLL